MRGKWRGGVDKREVEGRGGQERGGGAGWTRERWRGEVDKRKVEGRGGQERGGGAG